MVIELSDLISVGSCEYPKYSSAYCIGKAIWALVNTPAISASTADNIMCQRVLHTTRIGTLGTGCCSGVGGIKER